MCQCKVCCDGEFSPQQTGESFAILITSADNDRRSGLTSVTSSPHQQAHSTDDGMCFIEKLCYNKLMKWLQQATETTSMDKAEASLCMAKNPRTR